MTWNLALQYQLRRNLLLEVSYDGSAGIGLIETPNYNVLPQNYDAGNPTLLAQVAGSNQQFFRPYPNFGTVTYRGNISHSTYHAGTVHMQKRLSGGLTWDSFFTWSKSIDGTGVSNVDESSKLYKGLSAYDRKFRYVGNFSYDLPIGKGRAFMNRGGVLDAMFGGYTLVFQYDIYTGNPVTLGVTNGPNQLPGYIGIGGRPNVLGPVQLRENWQDLGGDRFVQGNQNSTICCLSNLAYPAAYEFGNAGKNTFITQRGIGASFSARKEFALRERLKLQLRFDFQNPFKWYNWGNMNTTVDLKNVINGVETAGNLFGKVPSGNEATTVADGGVPMMNATLKLVW